MKSPILFLIFNRPDTTIRVFEEIRKAQPPRLYVAADGPRANRSGEKELCEKTRSIATRVDWNCEVKTLFRDKNLGCGKAVSQAITWFFDNEPEGIILEDDIIPHPDFFPYCDELLEMYRDNEEIGIIAGACHIYEELNRISSYGFLSVPHIWGWATWKRSWDEYKYNISDIPIADLVHNLKGFGYNSKEVNYWKWIYHIMKNNRIDTWDYQWAITLMSKGKLNIYPYRGLTRNIGFSTDATHPVNVSKKEMEMKTYPIFPICHPSIISIDKESDRIDIQNGNRILSRYKYTKRHIASILKNVSKFFLKLYFAKKNSR